MSLPASDEGHYIPEWDSYSCFLNQPVSPIDSGASEWPPGITSQFDLSPGTLMLQDATNSIVGLSGISSTDESSKIPSQGPPASLQQESTQKPQKKRRGRPILHPDDSKTATERRRSQIRVAQKAYRQRKEGTMISLKTENKDLKDRLINIQLSFDELLAIALKSSLQPSQLDTIQSLSTTVERYRLSETLTNNDQLRSSMEPKNISIMSSEIDPQSASDNSEGLKTGANLPSRSTHFQDSLDNRFGINQTRSQILKELPISPFDQLPSTPIPFALKLRHEALKQGFRLITNPDTSFTLLCRTFQGCIFSETRNSIMRRLRHLLHQSTNFIYQTVVMGTKEMIALVDSFDGEQLRETLQFFDSQGSLASMAYNLAEDNGSATKGIPLIDGDIYIEVEGIRRYLLERGLDITAGSQFVSLPVGAALWNSTTTTLFDEIRGDRRLKLSVDILLHELLTRARCMDPGLGFRRAEIDEALKSALIKAV